MKKTHLYTSNSSAFGLLKQVLLLAFPLLAFVSGVNYWGDAAHIFHDDYEAKMAEIIASGGNAKSGSNFDERLFQKAHIQLKEGSPDVVVLGSSRSMMIDTSYFEGATLANLSVSGATLEDLMALYQITLEKGWKPQKIILGIDPWMFNINNRQIRWKSLNAEYTAFLGKKPSLKDRFYKTEQLFSLSYFQESFKALKKKKEFPEESAMGIDSTKNIRRPDGSISYSYSYRNRPDQIREEKTRDQLSRDLLGLGDFDEISPDLLKMFIDLLDAIAARNAEMIIYLSPYHPDAYRKIRKEVPLVLEVDKHIREVAAGRKLPVYGSFSPVPFQLGKANFYDSMHCMEEVGRATFILIP